MIVSQPRVKLRSIISWIEIATTNAQLASPLRNGRPSVWKIHNPIPQDMLNGTQIRRLVSFTPPVERIPRPKTPNDAFERVRDHEMFAHQSSRVCDRVSWLTNSIVFALVESKYTPSYKTSNFNRSVPISKPALSVQWPSLRKLPLPRV